MPLKPDRFSAMQPTNKAEMWAARSQTSDIQQTVEAQAMVKQPLSAKTKQEVWSERSEAGSGKTLMIVAVAAIAGYFLLKKKKH